MNLQYGAKGIFTLGCPEPREKTSLAPIFYTDTPPSGHHNRVKTPFQGSGKDAKSDQKDKTKLGFHAYIYKKISYL